MAQSALVLGGGMVGVCTAWHLRERGYDVTLVERGVPGRETSYGNAGLIQREAVEPYPFPHDVLKLAQVALQRGNDVSYRLRDVLAVSPRLAQYWWNSFPSRYQISVAGYEALIRHCLIEHDRMILASGAGNLVARHGWKQIFRTVKGFDEGTAKALALTRRFGVESRILDSMELAREEPALKRTMTGAIYWESPYSVSDPGGLVGRYAASFTAGGGRILKGDARSLRTDGAGWCVDTVDGTVSGEQAVIALGPWSEVVTRMLGYRLPLFVKRGYHRHFGWKGTLNTPMIDAEAGVAMLPMALGLRVTTGAEFALRDAPLSTKQMDGSECLAREMLNLGDPVEATPWLGSRPCTVDMLPLIGQAPSHRGLWFHFGHAHQGFTLGPTTGRLCAELMNGEAPYIDPSPYRPSRFGRAAQA
ncbi:FAD-dependent oxidoreductase [Acetobacter musti]|uniref:FAD-dependent oxidoreductase n=1 Tax=Acetobacter musti TaxID=864732 RepID=A0ABX0JT45_9PROT|nr:FAD-binding oxidoreductase [Acetobacter musti]NHN85115.1 FAD-dependent oxidoreductase [Acetobacter musti]